MKHDFNFTVCLTHDVDRIRKTYQYVTHDLRHGKIMKAFFERSKNDPYWNFDRIMSMERELGVRSTFFFLNESIKPTLFSPKSWLLSFGRYDIQEPEVIKIIKALDKDGWEIGLHGSFNSFNDKVLMKKEKHELESVLGKPVIGIRQHHLNLMVPETWKIQKSLGFAYDATFGAKREIGFLEDKIVPFVQPDSKLLIIPLAVMDGNLFHKAGNDPEKAWGLAESLIEIAEKKKAVLSILWHQRVFNDNEFPGWKDVYQKIIVECKKRGARFLTCKQISEEYLAE
ncbi:polysaccharide deacetylase family protein [Desulfotignum balticum]|uniref:polysaccharide deacetylase family protein n=1 Tax=Desulfotignum balticum TaxID=115781 RepID=UPI0003FBE1F6|nr:polysaccharide deacetylase family protein [Desulfotignum balticum]